MCTVSSEQWGICVQCTIECFNRAWFGGMQVAAKLGSLATEVSVKPQTTELHLPLKPASAECLSPNC